MSILKIFQIVSISLPIAFVLSFICRGPKVRGLSYWQVLAGLLLKVFLGYVYGVLFLTYYTGDDTWYYFRESLTQTELLKTDPATFFSELGPAAALRNYPGTLQAVEAYFADLEFYLQVKLLALFNMVSFSDYYIDMCLLNGFFFFGHYWLYRLLTERYESSQRWTFAAVFLFVPAVFWLSGIRSDGFLFLFISLTLFSVNRLLQGKQGIGIIGLSVGLAGTLIFRSAYGVLLLPALITWILIERGNRRAGIAIAGVYGTCLLLFFASLLVSPGKNAATALVERQSAFMKLDGKTRFEMEPLQPTFASIVSNIPSSLLNTLARPYPWEAKGLLQYFSVVENIVFVFIISVVVYRMKKAENEWYKDGFLLAVTAWFLSIYILSGLTVPFPGAIVRYKAIPELLLLSSLIARQMNTYKY